MLNIGRYYYILKILYIPNFLVIWSPQIKKVGGAAIKRKDIPTKSFVKDFLSFSLKY